MHTLAAVIVYPLPLHAMAQIAPPRSQCANGPEAQAAYAAFGFMPCTASEKHP